MADSENDTYEDISVRDRVNILGGSGFKNQMDNSNLVKPYKYDDALKYRFPDRKDYVTAHNYIPTRQADIQKTGRKNGSSDYEWGQFTNKFRKENQSADSDERRNFGKMNAAGRNGENRRGNKFTGPQNNEGGNIPVNINRPGKTNPQSHLFGKGYGGAPIYEYEDDKTLLSSLHDGTHAIRGTRISNSAADISKPSSALKGQGTKSSYDARDAERFNQIRDAHKASFATETSDKIYFNMMPQVYDYGDNKYYPLKLDEDGNSPSNLQDQFDSKMA